MIVFVFCHCNDKPTTSSYQIQNLIALGSTFIELVAAWLLSSCFNPLLRCASVTFIARLVAAPRCTLAPFVPQLPASFAISTMADTGGDLSPPFSPFLSPWARCFLSPPTLCPLVAGTASPSFDNNHVKEALADQAFVEAATGAVSPSFDNNHIEEALSDPVFVEAVKSAEETYQRKKKALPKYALDPNLPKVRQELIVDCFHHNVSLSSSSIHSNIISTDSPTLPKTST
jgi:hypothetical protein